MFVFTIIFMFMFIIHMKVTGGIAYVIALWLCSICVNYRRYLPVSFPLFAIIMINVVYILLLLLLLLL